MILPLNWASVDLFILMPVRTVVGNASLNLTPFIIVYRRFGALFIEELKENLVKLFGVCIYGALSIDRDYTSDGAIITSKAGPTIGRS